MTTAVVIGTYGSDWRNVHDMYLQSMYCTKITWQLHCSSVHWSFKTNAFSACQYCILQNLSVSLRHHNMLLIINPVGDLSYNLTYHQLCLERLFYRQKFSNAVWMRYEVQISACVQLFPLREIRLSPPAPYRVRESSKKAWLSQVRSRCCMCTVSHCMFTLTAQLKCMYPYTLS